MYPTDDIDMLIVQCCFIILTCWSGLTGVAGQSGLSSGLIVRFWSITWYLWSLVLRNYSSGVHGLNMG